MLLERPLGMSPRCFVSICRLLDVKTFEDGQPVASMWVRDIISNPTGTRLLRCETDYAAQHLLRSPRNQGRPAEASRYRSFGHRPQMPICGPINSSPSSLSVLAYTLATSISQSLTIPSKSRCPCSSTSISSASVPVSPPLIEPSSSS